MLDIVVSSAAMSVRIDVVLALEGKHESFAGVLEWIAGATAALRVSGACMFLAACGHSCALQACLPIESVMSEVDIFVSSKRNFNILDHMEELKNNAFRCALKIRPLKTVSSSPF